MLSPEFLSKVKRIEILARKIVNDSFSGAYRSHFRGQGVQFSEHRLYVAGDDVRHIDWKVTARSRDPVLKKYEEERDLTVLLVLDLSSSHLFGSQNKLKKEALAELAGLLALGASRAGDRVGCILFSGAVDKTIVPRRGRHHVLRIISEILASLGQTPGTALAQALEGAHRVMKHPGVVIVLSDFLAKGFEIPFQRLAKRHDVLAIQIRDPREALPMPSGILSLWDSETGTVRDVSSTSYRLDRWFREDLVAEREATQNQIRKSGADFLSVSTTEDYAEALVRFLGVRHRGTRR